MFSIEWLVDEAIKLRGIKEWLVACAEAEGKSFGEIAIIIGSDEWLLTYNRQFLNHDYYTDIITFDYVDGDVVSGDLLISIDRVSENALINDVSRETELKRVIIHGFLHLCGYSDKSDEEIEIMRKKEDFYLTLV